MFIKRMLPALLMIVLLIGAIYSTWSNMTNLSWQDIKNSLQEETNKVQEVEAMNTGEEKKDVRKAQQKRLSNAPIAIDLAEEEKDFKRKKVIATGYTAGYESTGKREGHPQYGVTFSGIPVKRDVFSTIAADVNVFPIGTILYIPNYGYGVVADIGGAIKGDKIDLYFHTVEDVYREWGKREVEVYIIREGNGTLSEAEFNQLNESDSLQVFQNEEEKAS